MAASGDHIRATVGRYIEFMNASDVDSIAALYAEDATLEDPVGAELLRGREAIRAFYAASVWIAFRLGKHIGSQRGYGVGRMHERSRRR